MRVGSICTGYGGLELGLGVREHDLAWVAEVNPAAAALLSVTHPGVPNLGDITAVDWTKVAPVDLLVGGIPCQPVSAAGKQGGTNDERWLWPYALDAIKALQPARFLLENVRNLVSIQKGAIFRTICDDLVGAGYSVRWLTLGACHVGLAHHRHRVFLLASRVDHSRELTGTIERVETTSCGAKDKSLPTPVARDGDGRGEGDEAYWAARAVHRNNGLPLGAIGALLPTPRAADQTGGKWEGASREGGPDLRTAVALLPTPRATDTGTPGRAPGEGWRPALSAALLPALLPTPRAADGSGGRIDLHAADRGAQQPLPTVAVLLPTPRATDGPKGSPNQGDQWGGHTMSSAVQPERFGKFEAAVAHHAARYGPPPEPTEPNRNGSPRLNPAFAEWLMAIPPGLITANVPGRNDVLRLIGNGVSPPQAALAWHLLTTTPHERNDTVSDTTQDLQGVAPTPDAEPPAEPDASFEQARRAGAFDDEIASILAFHGTPVAAQALREVLGFIGRAATEAARRRPQNRPTELQGKGWEKASLLALGELCAELAPEVGSVNAPRDPDLFPDATHVSSDEQATQLIADALGGVVVTDIEAQRAELASHRAQVVRERAAAGNGNGPVEPMAAVQMAMVTIGSGDGIDVVEVPASSIPGPPEPWVAPEVWDAAADPFHAPDPWAEPAETLVGAPDFLPVFHSPDPSPLDGPPF